MNCKILLNIKLKVDRHQYIDIKPLVKIKSRHRLTINFWEIVINLMSY